MWKTSNTVVRNLGKRMLYGQPIDKCQQERKGFFKYVRLNIEQNGDEIFVNQQAYVDGLKEIAIDKERMNN